MLAVMYVTLRRLSLKNNILNVTILKLSGALLGTDVIFLRPYTMLPNNIKCFTHYLLFLTTSVDTFSTTSTILSLMSQNDVKRLSGTQNCNHVYENLLKKL